MFLKQIAGGPVKEEDPAEPEPPEPFEWIDEQTIEQQLASYRP